MAVFSPLSRIYVAAFCTAMAALGTARAASEKVLYSFKGGNDGAYPDAGLIAVDGTLYGTTSEGGGSGCSQNNGCGTVFKVTTAGVETVLHAFKGAPDGSYPTGALINVHGTLYGTAGGGGTGNSDGTVFKVTTEGAETTLYSFQGGTDGAGPSAGLIDLGGTLYGTTEAGGNGNGVSGYGTVFKVTKTGAETVLYAFKGTPDGRAPLAALINVGGTLYGTTELGGDPGCASQNYGCGTVFKVTTAGAETVLYSFTGGSDGRNPFAGLTKVGDALYGTTFEGGSDTCEPPVGCGTVYSLTMAGAETVVYSFQSSHDGLFPYAGLTKLGDKFYGTTLNGGKGCSKHGDCGTAFSLTKAGVEKIVYRFAGHDGGDGEHPLAGLINLDGTLYGTTAGGGTGGGSGYGTVCGIKP